MSEELVRVRLRTHAKVNLFLRVVGRRPDGYHEIETILHGISFGDDIEVALTDGGGIEVDMELAEGVLGEPPTAQENLAYRAAQALVGRAGGERGVRVRIVKHIPIGAGLGGGSGNAAGIIVALNELWRLSLDRADTLAVAATVGSDVPYCIEGGTALATARGEKLTPLPAPADLHIVLGMSHEGLLTRDVYAAFDEVGPQDAASPSPMTLALGAGNVHEVADLLYNDLEVAAFKLRPRLQDKKEALLAAGALGAAMSGSGPTMFAIAENEDHAHDIADAVRTEFDVVRVTRSRPECIEFLQREVRA